MNAGKQQPKTMREEGKRERGRKESRLKIIVEGRTEDDKDEEGIWY